MRWGCFVVMFFCHFGSEHWRFLKKKRGKKGICAVAKLVPHVWDGNWLTQGDGEGQGEGGREWVTGGRKRGALSPSRYSLKRKTRMQGITPGNQEMPACRQALCLLPPPHTHLNMATFKRISDCAVVLSKNLLTRGIHSSKVHLTCVSRKSFKKQCINKVLGGNINVTPKIYV